MEEFKDFIEGIEDTKHRERFLEVIGWVDTHYPHLKKEMKWKVKSIFVCKLPRT